jgi:hypothetical protein
VFVFVVCEFIFSSSFLVGGVRFFFVCFYSSIFLSLLVRKLLKEKIKLYTKQHTFFFSFQGLDQGRILSTLLRPSVRVKSLAHRADAAVGPLPQPVLTTAGAAWSRKEAALEAGNEGKKAGGCLEGDREATVPAEER